MVNDLSSVYKFINEQKKNLEQNDGDSQNIPLDIKQIYSDMLECAQIGIDALAMKQITDSDKFAGIPLKKAVEIILEYTQKDTV